MQASYRCKRTNVRSNSKLSQESISTKIYNTFALIDKTIMNAKIERSKDLKTNGETHWTINRWDSFIHGLETSKEFLKNQFKKCPNCLNGWRRDVGEDSHDEECSTCNATGVVIN